MLEVLLMISLFANFILVMCLVSAVNKAGYYEGKNDIDNEGWQDEAKFWRKVVYPKVKEY